MQFFTAIVQQTENRTFAVIYPTTLFSINEKISRLDAGTIISITITAL